jgi:hypothetical protein
LSHQRVILKVNIAEKEQHSATKKILDKAIGLATILLNEIQHIDMKQKSPTRVSMQNPLLLSVDTMASVEPLLVN